MAEKLIQPESHESHEQHNNSSEHHERLKQTIEAAKHAENDPKESIEAIKQSVEKYAVSGREVGVHDKQPKPAAGGGQYGLSKALKKDALQKTLKQTRRHLSTPERTLSRVIHQPVIDKVSTVAASTLARPSGILIGGIGALIGSTVLYFMSKYYGFNYNFLVYTLLFCACYIVGVIAEFLWRSVRKLGQKN